MEIPKPKEVELLKAASLVADEAANMVKVGQGSRRARRAAARFVATRERKARRNL